jgi:hypothetical protein
MVHIGNDAATLSSVSHMEVKLVLADEFWFHMVCVGKWRVLWFMFKMLLLLLGGAFFMS